jgi:hypothetical protein
MKKLYLLTLLILFITGLGAQEPEYTISGRYQSVPLKSFLKEVEQKYPVYFFYDEKTVDAITVNAEFKETPLKEALEMILDGELAHFYALDESKFVIYKGFAIKSLFLGKEEEQEEKSAPLAEQISREKLEQMQYRIFNIGTPGKNNLRTATISGYIKEFNSNDPVIGASVYIVETQKGVSTDKNGFYSLILPTGNHTLNFSCIGMEPTKRIINLYSNGNLNVEMITKVNLLGGIDVMGEGEGNLGRVQMGIEKMDLITLKSIPALFGEADVLKSILTLPGVQTVGEGTSGFNVRGGKTDQNLVLIDQAPIYYPSHFFGNFSAVNSEIVDNAVLYKGSLPVRYGGRISSVFEINTKQGNKEKIEGAGGISPVSARFHIDGPISKNLTFLASFRSTYSNWVLNAIKVKDLYKSKIGFYDAQLKTNFFLNEDNGLTLNLYSSNDRFQLQSDSVYNYQNTIASIAWDHNYSKRLRSATALSYSGFGYDISNEANQNQAFSLKHSVADVGFKTNFEFTLQAGLTFNFGADINHYIVNPGERTVGELSNVKPIFANDESALEFGTYIGSEYGLTDRLKVEGGVRLSGMFAFGDGKTYRYAPGLPLDEDNITDTLFSSKNTVEASYLNPEFRLSANYTINAHSSFKLSYNKTAQYIHMLSNTTAISPTDTWKLSDKYLAPQTGHQISAGYFRNFSGDKIETSIEGFYKRIKNIKEYKAGADLLLNDHIETEILNGLGRSYGAELSVEKKGGRVYGRVNYTYSRTLIKSDTEFEEELINNGEYFPANYDKPHSLTVLANAKALRRLILSTTVNYSTGRPITYPVAQYKLGDQVFLHYSDYNQYRIPDYFRMDLSVTLEGNLKLHKLVHSTFTFSLYNITARKNAYSVYFRSEGTKYEAYKLSIFGTIIPTLTYNFRF